MFNDAMYHKPERHKVTSETKQSHMRIAGAVSAAGDVM